MLGLACPGENSTWCRGASSAGRSVRIPDEQRHKPHLTNLGKKRDLLPGFFTGRIGELSLGVGVTRMRSKARGHISEPGP